MGQDNVGKLADENSSPLIVGRYEKAEIIDEVEGDSSPFTRNNFSSGQDSPGIIFRTKNQGLKINIVKMEDEPMSVPTSIIKKKVEPSKNDLQFEKKFNKIRKFQSDIGNLMEEN